VSRSPRRVHPKAQKSSPAEIALAGRLSPPALTHPDIAEYDNRTGEEALKEVAKRLRISRNQAYEVVQSLAEGQNEGEAPSP